MKRDRLGKIGILVSISLFFSSLVGLCACKGNLSGKKAEIYSEGSNDIDISELISSPSNDIQETLAKCYSFLESEPPSDLVVKVLIYIADIYMYRCKDYAKAIVEYMQVVDNYAEYPGIDMVRIKLAEAYKRRGKFSQAAIEYMDVIRNTQNNALKELVIKKLGALYFSCGEYREALNSFSLLLKRGKGVVNVDVDLFLMVGLCYEYLHKTKEARKYYSMAAQHLKEDFILKRISRVGTEKDDR